MRNVSFLVRLGGLLFRWRDYTPLPLLGLFLLFAEPKRTWTGIGTGLLILGESLRLASLRYIGGASRTRGASPGKTLVTAGPFRWVRNPLYLGNLGITLGVGFLSGRLWAVGVAGVSFGVQYIPIVRWEEKRLHEEFGDVYDAYRKQVPRWIPRRGGPLEGFPAPLREALRTERRTLTALFLVWILFAVRSQL